MFRADQLTVGQPLELDFGLLIEAAYKKRLTDQLDYRFDQIDQLTTRAAIHRLLDNILKDAQATFKRRRAGDDQNAFLQTYAETITFLTRNMPDNPPQWLTITQERLLTAYQALCHQLPR